MPAARIIPNRGPMSGFLKPFDVLSRLTDQAYRVSFSHLWNGIATRHSDTVDAKFFVDGRSILVGLAHSAFVQFREHHGRDTQVVNCCRQIVRRPRDLGLASQSLHDTAELFATMVDAALQRADRRLAPAADAGAARGIGQVA